MSFKIIALALFTAALAHAWSPHPGNNNPRIGMWHGQLDGQPGVIVTFGTDSGEMAGSVVFNLAWRQGGRPHGIGSDALVLLHSQLDGITLKFRAIRKSDARQMHISLRLTTEGKAQLQCADCSDGNPVQEVVKVKW